LEAAEEGMVAPHSECLQCAPLAFPVHDGLCETVNDVACAHRYHAGMPASLNGQLVVALSSRALFDFEEENRLFEAQDDRAYMQLQLQRLDVPAKPGVAFSLAKKLLAFNTLGSAPRVEVVILSRNDPVSGLRVFRSAAHYGLPVQRGVFTRGQPPWRYLRPLAAHLFLSANEADVRSGLAAGVPAARVYPESTRASDAHPHELRIAFDGDAVLFSDEAERVFQTQGLAAFQQHETEHSGRPLAPGPFLPLLTALHALQAMPVEASGGPKALRVRTALVTARSAPAHERAIRTLMDWRIDIDEAMFLGGLPKGEFLREFEPDFFFDDQTGHVESAALHVPAGLVTAGISHAATH
jgi:5'-nucleotidase